MVDEIGTTGASQAKVNLEALGKAPKVYANAHILTAGAASVSVVFALNSSSIGIDADALLPQAIVFLDKAQALNLAQSILEVCGETRGEN